MEALERLSAALDASCLWEGRHKPKSISGLKELSDYASLTRELKQSRGKDTGGRRKMHAFDIFVQFLVDAYCGATGKAVTLRTLCKSHRPAVMV